MREDREGGIDIHGAPLKSTSSYFDMNLQQPLHSHNTPLLVEIGQSNPPSWP